MYIGLTNLSEPYLVVINVNPKFKKTPKFSTLTTQARINHKSTYFIIEEELFFTFIKNIIYGRPYISQGLRAHQS